jgi:hypothetical protein
MRKYHIPTQGYDTVMINHLIRKESEEGRINPDSIAMMMMLDDVRWKLMEIII